MALIDEARALAIYGDMGKDSGTAVEMSGGSAANTIVGLASFGARTAFIGRARPRLSRPTSLDEGRSSSKVSLHRRSVFESDIHLWLSFFCRALASAGRDVSL